MFITAQIGIFMIRIDLLILKVHDGKKNYAYMAM